MIMNKVTTRIVMPFVVLVLVCNGMGGQVEANLLDRIKTKAEDTAKVFSNICVVSDNCNRDFFNLNNYCCLLKAQCCNMVDYIFQNDKHWDNFVETFKDPRPINIILILISILILSALVSMLLSLIGYFFCGCTRLCCCCGTRKYSIVNH